MPYTIESGTSDTPGRREHEKAWRRRNSDGKDTWEGERSQGPPGFERNEYPLPMLEAQRPADRNEPEGVAERHEHVWSVDEPDWEVQP